MQFLHTLTEQILCFNSLVDDVSVALNGFGAINWYDSPEAQNPLNPSTFAGMDVTLFNTSTGEQQNLKFDNDYTFYSDEPNLEGMLFIEFRQATVTGVQDNEVCYSDCISIYAKENHVYVYSSPNEKILNLTLLEESGMQLYRNYNMNTNSFDIQTETESTIFVA